jgi:hypothetical protein
MKVAAVEARPRTAGEVLDDAWDLALGDRGALLLLGGLFDVPAAAALLLLLGRPAEGGPLRPLLPALAALLWPLTGVGSGACQEWFLCRARGQAPGVGRCLIAALRRGHEHAAARAVVLVGVLLGLGCLILPGLAIWVSCAPLHPLLALGRAGPWAGLPAVSRQSALDLGKAGVVVLSRVPLLLLASVNLLLLAEGLLWVMGNLGGLDTAYLGVQFGLGNPVYWAVLLLLSWLLLGPYFEASNFLLHVDSRTRHEGLDLLVRVHRVLSVGGAPEPQAESVRGAGPVRAGVLLALALGLLAGVASARAEDAPRRLSREEIKSFLRTRAPGGQGQAHPRRQRRPRQAESRRPVVESDKEDRPTTRPGARRALGTGAGGVGLGSLGWAVLAGVAVAVLLVAGLLFRSSRRERPAAPTRREAGTSAPLPAPEPAPHEQPAGVWWRRADELARADRFLDAVRAVYLAVLSQLHRGELLRYEPTRTNGEYVRQVSLAPQAPPELRALFERLTNRFEVYWYGGVPCGSGEFRACRSLAQEVRSAAGD